jgi:hypothetical protein
MIRTHGRQPDAKEDHALSRVTGNLGPFSVRVSPNMVVCSDRDLPLSRARRAISGQLCTSAL